MAAGDLLYLPDIIRILEENKFFPKNIIVHSRFPNEGKKFEMGYSKGVVEFFDSKFGAQFDIETVATYEDIDVVFYHERYSGSWFVLKKFEIDKSRTNRKIDFKKIAETCEKLEGHYPLEYFARI